MSENALQTQAARPPIMVGQRGLQLVNIDDMWRFAQYVIKSGLAPSSIKTPEQALVAMQMGMELGLMPMQSIQNITVINGRPSVWGDAVLALVQTHPDYLDIEEDIEGEGDNMVAVCRCYKKSRGMDRPVVRRFSVADAKKANLWGKQGPWSTNPKRMLQMRARGFGCRDSWPGALRGLYLAEEVQDIEAIDVTATPTGTAQMDALVDREKAKAKPKKSPKAVEPESGAQKTPETPQEAPEPEPEPDYDQTPDMASEAVVDGYEGVWEEDEAEEPEETPTLSREVLLEEAMALKAAAKMKPADLAKVLTNLGCEKGILSAATPEQLQGFIAHMKKSKY